MQLDLPPPRPATDSIGNAGEGRYLRNAWYVAMWAEQLRPGALEPRTILNEPIVFWRAEDRRIVAVTDRCPHRFAPLHRGRLLEGDRLQCGYHGLEFNRNGACSRNPYGNHHIPPAAKLRSYPAVEKHSLIWVWMGQGEPDLSAIPDFSVLDGVPEDHIAKRDVIRVKAHYELVTDNLLDLSHTSFLHDGILGNAEMVESEITVEQDGDSVTVGRASEGKEIPGLFAILVPYALKRVDKWNTIRWTPPGNMLLRSGVCPPGAKPQTGTGYFGIHLLTPETDRTTIYHFTAVRWNVLTQDAALNAEIKETLTRTRRFAFEEQDAPMIEDQQRMIDASPVALRPALLAIDVGPVRYKRILDRLIDAEQATAEVAG
jgi:vanillate O-demethylase monooxygenase subunit